jgi:hypothetical protein
VCNVFVARYFVYNAWYCATTISISDLLSGQLSTARYHHHHQPISMSCVKNPILEGFMFTCNQQFTFATASSVHLIYLFFNHVVGQDKSLSPAAANRSVLPSSHNT